MVTSFAFWPFSICAIAALQSLIADQNGRAVFDFVLIFPFALLVMNAMDFFMSITRLALVTVGPALPFALAVGGVAVFWA